MRKLPPLNSVRIFESAARNLSFTLAANELHITTAAVSHQIKHLEESLGAKLFVRTSRNVKLSPVGERLLPLISEGFDRIADAFSEIDEKKSANVISLTTTRSFAEKWLLPRLLKFQTRFPDILINLDASDMVVDLRAGEADLAIRYGRDPDGGVPVLELFSDKYVAVCHASVWNGNSVPQLTDLRPRHLLASRWIHQSNSPDWIKWLTLAGIDPSTFEIKWFNEEGLAIQAMEHGQGALLCSNVLISDQLRERTCHQIEGPELDGMRYRMLAAPASARKKSVQNFTSWLSQEVSDFVNRSTFVVN
jgi:LysR family transcriptional regulator, glycine cleavage system transcriptional activator